MLNAANVNGQTLGKMGKMGWGYLPIAPSLKLFHLAMVHGKEDDLNASMLHWYVVKLSNVCDW